jgi:hypothetical protein
LVLYTPLQKGQLKQKRLEPRIFYQSMFLPGAFPKNTGAGFSAHNVQYFIVCKRGLNANPAWE